MSERPRRTVRPTTKQPVLLSEKIDNGAEGSRKGEERPTKQSEKLFDINYLLTDPKSHLTRLDMMRVLNLETWNLLSPESRERLCGLLPRSAFGYVGPEVGTAHPSKRHQFTESSSLSNRDRVEMAIDVSPASLEPSFFNDPHFEAACRTFQDHLYSGWLRKSHSTIVSKYEDMIKDGSLHAPWKDDLWDEEHPEAENYDDSRELASTFKTLVDKGLLMEGDLLTFKRKFTALGVVLEKEALITSITTSSGLIRFIAHAGQTNSLPAPLLASNNTDSLVTASTDKSRSLREVFASSSQQLTMALMDLDGRLSRDQRPYFVADKALTVWRILPGAADEILTMAERERALLEKGGRQKFGTLFYLRQQTRGE